MRARAWYLDLVQSRSKTITLRCSPLLPFDELMVWAVIKMPNLFQKRIQMFYEKAADKMQKLQQIF